MVLKWVAAEQLGRLRDCVVPVRVAAADDDDIVKQSRAEEFLTSHHCRLALSRR